MLTALATVLWLVVAVAPVRGQRPAYAFVNGQWFNGSRFERRTVYSVNGRLSTRKPSQIDRTFDLAGGYVVPPFAEAHNHNLGTGSEKDDREAIRRYLRDGVFYVKIQGNLPLTADAKRRLGLNTSEAPDVVFAQGNLTASGGHPIALIEQVLLPNGYFPGQTKDSVKDFRYFTVDSARELDRKWPRILGLHPDFIKVMLLFSEEFEKRRADPAYFGQKGLDPRLIPIIVQKAHAAGLKVSAHVATGGDFGAAVGGGVDEVAHIPSVSEISDRDAAQAAQRHVTVDTTCAVTVPSLIRIGAVREADVRRTEASNLRRLRRAGVRLAVGSDEPSDTSVKEVMYLHRLGVFDNRTLLQLWAGTSRTIFPDRRIGALRDGFEASFLVLEGDPLADFDNVTRIRLRFKQGVWLERFND